MSKTRTSTPEQKLGNRRDDAIMRLRLLTRLATETVVSATPEAVGLEQWELLALLEMQAELLNEVENADAALQNIANERYMTEHPELFGKTVVQ